MDMYNFSDMDQELKYQCLLTSANHCADVLDRSLALWQPGLVHNESSTTFVT